MTFARLVDSINAITCWGTSLLEFCGFRRDPYVMARVFNNRVGFGPGDNRVIRHWHEPMPDGPLKRQRIDPQEIQDALALYYDVFGWGRNGRPTPGKLIDLNLEWLIEAGDHKG